jgi:hypothetical protein
MPINGIMNTFGGIMNTFSGIMNTFGDIINTFGGSMTTLNLQQSDCSGPGMMVTFASAS